MINIEKTKEVLKIDIQDLRPSSCKLVYWNCEECNAEQLKRFTYAKRSSICRRCSNGKISRATVDKRRITLKEWYQNNPNPKKGVPRPQHVIDALKNSDKSIFQSQSYRDAASKRMLGINNPFYGKKHSEKSLSKMQETAVKNAKRGKESNLYGKIYHGKGEWFTNKQGVKYWMRSSWEVKYASYLDSIGANWLYEYKRFDLAINSKECSYTPDFYFPDGDFYVEVKGYWREDAKEKFEQFKKDYSKIKILVYGKSELKKIGVI